MTTAERQALQPIAIDLDLEYAPGAFALAASTGDVAQAVDYAAVAARVLEVLRVGLRPALRGGPGAR